MQSLSALYDRVSSASAAGDARAAHAAFMSIVGLAPRRVPDAVPTAQPARTVTMLRYDRPRRIDILALLAGARSVAKFEDLSSAGAAELETKFRAKNLQVVRVGPYTKRFDVAVSETRTSQADARLYTVIASAGPEAQAVADAERVRSAEGTRRAGLALGYPACCVDHFVEAEQSAAAQAEGINEAAIRSIEGYDGPVRWEMNTLSVMAPIGFTPCKADCPAALAFARRVLGAVEQTSRDEMRVVKQVLCRPILFFRHPLFHVLDRRSGATEASAVEYAHALPSDDGKRQAALSAWQHEELGSVLEAGDSVELDASCLVIRAGTLELARWEVAERRVPMLLRFHD